jgi:predicted nucleic acid-binding protein
MSKRWKENCLEPIVSELAIGAFVFAASAVRFMCSLWRTGARRAAEGALVICPVVYAELLAHPKASPDFVDDFLAATDILIDFSIGESVWREVAARFAKYAVRRRASRGGSAKRLVADFVVGAHALIRADRLLTLDRSRYSRDFPELELIAGQ